MYVLDKHLYMVMVPNEGFWSFPPLQTYQTNTIALKIISFVLSIACAFIYVSYFYNKQYNFYT